MYGRTRIRVKALSLLFDRQHISPQFAQKITNKCFRILRMSKNKIWTNLLRFLNLYTFFKNKMYFNMFYICDIYIYTIIRYLRLVIQFNLTIPFNSAIQISSTIQVNVPQRQDSLRCCCCCCATNRVAGTLALD